MKQFFFIIIGLAALLAAIFAFKPTKDKTDSAKPIAVVSFTILEDFVKNICGNKFQVVTIVGRNADGHVFRPKPSTSETITKANIVFINGMGFEGWITRLIAATSYKGPVIVASKGVIPPEAHEDPHAWNDISSVKIYIENITNAFIQNDPSNKEFYTHNKINYIAKLDALDKKIKTELQNLPTEKRRFVTAHDAFKYFARAYKVKVLSPVGVSTEQEASAKDVGHLIDYIKKEGIKTIFVENITNEKLIRQIATETGAKLGGVLYSDALSELNEPAPTYLELMQHNFNLLYAAMKE